MNNEHQDFATIKDTRKIVYLVDNTDSFLMYLRILLERMGFRVIPLKKWGLLKELSRVVVPDLVLLGNPSDKWDVSSVFDTSEDHISQPRPPVVLISKHDEDDLGFDWREEGFTGCLSRPINIFTLFKVLYDSIVFASGEKRFHLRTSFREKIAITIDEDSKTYRATSLSEGGVFIRTSTIIPAGTQVVLEIPVGFGPSQNIEGEVLYTRETIDDGEAIDTGVAITFTSISDEQRTQLTVCILGLLVGDILEDQEEPVLSLVSQTNVLYEEILADHVQLNQKLIGFQNQLRRTVHALPLGMVTYRPTQKGSFDILSWNPAMESMFGAAMTEPKGLWQALFSAEDIKLEQAMRNVAANGGTVRCDNVQVECEEGPVLFDALVFQPTCGLGALIISDVTDKKRREEEEFRLHKLESLGVLAGGIAHDFNNLLQSARGGVELSQIIGKSLENDLNPEKVERILMLLDQAGKGLERASKLSHQLLTFARGGSPVIKPLQLSPIISEATDFALRGGNVSSRTKLPPGLDHVAGDSGQLHQVFLNLVLNAKQSMPGGGNLVVEGENISISDEAGPVSPGQYVQVTIKDNGIGIPAKILNRVFDPYFTTKQGGSGLGLANAFSIARKHHGWIDIDSVVGEGTTVKVLLPATTAPDTHGAGIESTELWQGEGRVIIMDDELALWQVAEGMVELLGFESQCVRDGTDLLRVYAEALEAGSPFDLVIMDLTIQGGMGGHEAIVKLLKIDPEARVIVSSGYSDDPAMASHADYGFSAALPKPYSIQELATVVRSVMTRALEDSGESQ